MRRILFVCTGNTCRSPMAMSIFNHLADRELSGLGYEAASAGLSVPVEEPPSTNAILAIKSRLGTDISGHRAHSLSEAEAEAAYLILTMTRSHKNAILSMYPKMHQKVYTLKEYAYGLSDGHMHSGSRKAPFNADVADPFGGSPKSYMLCAEEIEDAVKKLVEKLKKG